MKEEINLTLPIKYSITDQALTKLGEDYAVLPADLTVKENYSFIKGGLSKIRKFKGEVETKRKELKKDALEYGRKVDSAARIIKNRLLDIEAPIKKAKTDFDTAVEIAKRKAERLETERTEKIFERIAEIKSIVETHLQKTSTEISATISELKDDDLIWAEEFVQKAENCKVETLKNLQELFLMKKENEKAEQDRLEFEKERKEQEEIKRQADLKAEEKKRQADLKLAEENKKHAEEIAAQRRELARQRRELADQQEEITAQKRAVKAAEEKAEQERLAKIEAEKEKKRAERVEKENRIKEEAETKAEKEKKEAEAKAEKETLKKAKAMDEENFKLTLKEILPYVKSNKAGADLLNKIRSGLVKHVTWKI